MLIHLHNRAIVRHWFEDNGEGDNDAEGAGGELETTLHRYVVRRSLEPKAFTAHTHTTSSFRSQPWAARPPCRR